MNKAGKAILQALANIRTHRGKGKHARKSGPGRMPIARHSEGARRLETRTQGGNWQGQPYMSYADMMRPPGAGYPRSTTPQRARPTTRRARNPC